MIVHRGDRFQRGRGFGSFFATIFRTLKPLVSMGLSTGKKFLTSDTAKTIGRTALDIGKDAAKNIAKDVLTGKNIRESLDKELEVAKDKIANKISGSGSRKRKRLAITHHKLNKRYSLLD